MDNPELAREYAELYKQAAVIFGVELTAKEKTAIPLVIGAYLRERHKIDLPTIVSILQRFAG